MIVSPSILSADFANLEADVKSVQNAGAKWIHIDVMDGHFVPNITIGAPVVKSLRLKTDMFLDVHLMIEHPLKYASDFIKAGADLITFHIESKSNILETIQTIKNTGVKVGLSIKPKTSPDVLSPYVNLLDLVLVMTVEPGFGGQSFMPNCADKIPVIKQMTNNQNLIIQVDGGIDNNSAKICKALGANCLVAGNYIYNSNNINNAIASLLD